MSTQPTDEEIDAVTLEVLGYAALDKNTNETARLIARAVLAKWGSPQAVREPYRGHRSKDSASVTLDADTLARKGQWIDEQYAHKLALELECMLIDPERYWDSAAKMLDEYKSAWNEINPSPSPFGSDFAVPPERRAIYAAIKAKRG